MKRITDTMFHLLIIELNEDAHKCGMDERVNYSCVHEGRDFYVFCETDKSENPQFIFSGSRREVYYYLRGLSHAYYNAHYWQSRPKSNL